MPDHSHSGAHSNTTASCEVQHHTTTDHGRRAGPYLRYAVLRIRVDIGRRQHILIPTHVATATSATAIQSPQTHNHKHTQAQPQPQPHQQPQSNRHKHTQPRTATAAATATQPHNRNHTATQLHSYTATQLHSHTATHDTPCRRLTLPGSGLGLALGAETPGCTQRHMANRRVKQPHGGQSQHTQRTHVERAHSRHLSSVPLVLHRWRCSRSLFTVAISACRPHIATCNMQHVSSPAIPTLTRSRPRRCFRAIPSSHPVAGVERPPSQPPRVSVPQEP